MKLLWLTLLILVSFSFSFYKAEGFKEQFSIIIENKVGGQILLETSSTTNIIGTVLVPVEKFNQRSFTAARWGDIGSVIAAAVNAIHIKTDHNRSDDHSNIFSILPVDQKDRAKYNSYYDQSSSIVTNIPAGKEIFGGRYSPLVDNPVFVKSKGNEELHLISAGYQPAIGDQLIIKVLFPDPYPEKIVLENKFNGTVLRPVLGIGRFIGTKYSDSSRIRANHKGVIDVSTSPLGKVGGFQIIPAKHGESPEMLAAKTKTQWMVVAPLDNYPFELFSGYIIPRYHEADLNSKDWMNELADQTLVQCRQNKVNDWNSLPIIAVEADKPLPNKMNTALKDVTHLRILLPIRAKMQ